MNSFLVRVKHLFIRPQEEWKAIHEERPTYGTLLCGYVALLAAIPPFAAVVERLTFGRNLEHALPIARVLTMNALWYCVIIANMVLTASVLTAVVFSKESRWLNPRALQLAIFSFTPLFVVTIPLLFPYMMWLLYPAVLYSVYLLYLGIRTLTNASIGKAVGFAVLSLLISGAVIGALDGAEYMLETFVAGKLHV
jgi:hypothetical protein